MEIEEPEKARRARSPREAKLCAVADQIRSLPIEDRLRQIEAEANFFTTAKPIK